MSFAEAFDRIFRDIFGHEWRSAGGHAPPRPMPPPAPQTWRYQPALMHPLNRRCSADKPHVRRLNGQWICTSADNRWAYGATPRASYLAWRGLPPSLRGDGLPGRT